MKLHKEAVSSWLTLIQTFLEQFGWLADCFVLDFYVDDHWSKLPKSWRDYLDKLEREALSRLIDLRVKGVSAGGSGAAIPPLSLQCFKEAIRVLSLNREVRRDNDELINRNSKLEVDKHLSNLFARHVKLKKRHEVERMGEVVTHLSSLTRATHVYDIGSGLGHLSRYLTYACGLTLTCVDKEEAFKSGATKFDTELEKFLAKQKNKKSLAKEDAFPAAPSHLSINLDLNDQDDDGGGGDSLNSSSRYFQSVSLSSDHKFGLIGLHSCGNLSVVVMKNYAESEGAKFLVSLGCCYMKLDGRGFPLSRIAKRLNMKLTYEALEVACHATEQYCDRLCSGDPSKLKTHSYRAALETILTTHHNLKRAGLRSVPHTDELSFEQYALKATSSLPGIKLDAATLSTPQIQNHLRNWFRVVKFYCLRLMVANVVESAVLLDRGAYLLQSTSDVHLAPIFNYNLSPRCIGLVSWKQ